MAICLLAALPARAGEVVRVDFVEPDGRFRWLPEPRAPSQPRLGIALGGGAVWGISHLGFLSAMSDAGVRPDLVAGTSVGAIIGGALAAGYSPEDIVDLIRMQDASGQAGAFGGWRRPERAWPADPLAPQAALGRWGRTWEESPLRPYGLFPDQQIVNALANYLARADALDGGDLDRLAFPFRAVATDLLTGETYAPRHAPLTTMVRASIGLPVFAPVPFDGRLLVDGGATEVVPIPTVRGMGAEVAVGVRLSRDGERIEPFRRRPGFRAVSRRYDAIGLADQRARLLEEADLVVESTVGDAPIGNFSGGLERLIQAGRDAWERQGDRMVALLEERAPSAEPLRVVAVTAAEEQADLAAALGADLGLSGGPRTLSRLRLELALCRLVLRHDLAEVRLQVDPDGTARLGAQREPVVRRIEVDAPGTLRGRLLDLPTGVGRRAILTRVGAVLRALHQEGTMFAGITAMDWDAGDGTLRLRVEAGELDSIAAWDDTSRVEVPRLLAEQGGSVADVESLGVALDRSEQEGYLLRPRIAGARATPRGLALDVRVEPEPRWEVSWNLGIADMLGPTVWLGTRLPRFTPGSGWGMEFSFSAGKEGRVGQLELGPRDREGWSPLVLLEAGRLKLPLYDAGGSRDGSLGFGQGLGAAGMAWRGNRSGNLELLAVAHQVSDRAFLDPGEESLGGVDVGLEARWRGDLPGVPWTGRVGVSWSMDAHVPLAGVDRAPSARGEAVLRVSLDGARRWLLTASARAAGAAGDDPLPLDRWSEPGAWWEAPPLSPGQGRARSVLRGGVTLSRRVGRALPLYLGASLSWWRLDEERADLFLDDTGYGGSVFAELALGRLGSVMLGFADGDQEGDRVYFLFGPARTAWP